MGLWDSPRSSGLTPGMVRFDPERSAAQVTRYSTTPIAALFEGFSDDNDLPILFRSMRTAYDQMVETIPRAVRRFSQPEFNPIFDGAVSMELRLMKQDREIQLIQKVGGTELLQQVLEASMRYRIDPASVIAGPNA